MKNRYAFVNPAGDVTVTEIVPGTWRDHRTVAELNVKDEGAREKFDELNVQNVYRTK